MVGREGVVRFDVQDAVIVDAPFRVDEDAVDAPQPDAVQMKGWRAGKPAGTPTFHLYGIGLWCIDGILVDSKWGVHDHRILDVKPNNTFPSDHFALLADLALLE